MWLFFGLAAVLTATLNLICTLRHRDAKWFRFASMACTAFTLCAFLNQSEQWVVKEDWSALMDVMPGSSGALWVLTLASVAVNSISLFKKK